MFTEGEIQDILTDMGDDTNFYDYIHDYEEITVIEDDDIIYINDEEALWAAIVGVLKTEQGRVDGVTLENYGSRLLTLVGEQNSWFNAELAKVYIRETIPQFQGYVIDFPTINVYEPTPETYDRMRMIIEITVNSVFGIFTRKIYI